ncbi:MAG: element excision factor XisI family protein [Saprospiraceae bacterium]|nr:element excision factor XisI family protein [Saprospiraceae bacterium]
MDRIDFFRQAIDKAMTAYVEDRSHSQSFSGLQFERIADRNTNRFLLTLVGWNDDERIYHLIFHADIIGDKIWIQEDNSDESAASLLEQQGVDKKDIVLAYYPDYHRANTAYAVS